MPEKRYLSCAVGVLAVPIAPFREDCGRAGGALGQCLVPALKGTTEHGIIRNINTRSCLDRLSNNIWRVSVLSHEWGGFKRCNNGLVHR
jgi:hypothetical protein